LLERKTKIVATIGNIPVNKKVYFLKNLIKAGVDIIRINMSHKNEGDEGELLDLISTIRNVSRDVGKPVAIMADIQGPKIRLGNVPDSKASIKKGEHIRLGTCENADITIRNCPGFTKKIADAIKDDTDISINIGDGALMLDALKVEGKVIEFVTRNNGKIRTGQGVTIRGIRLPSDKYRIENYPHDIWSVRKVAEYVDMFSLSFVNTGDDIDSIHNFISNEVMNKHEILERFGGLSEFPVIAKIETDDGVMNIDSIIDRAFGIMVARGDMGLQMGLENVPLAQKEIARRANIWGKPVIVATQMLASMVSSPEPTRAEVSDVANAIIDGADALMLSDETAIGEFPIESVNFMDRIARSVEKKVYGIEGEGDEYVKLGQLEELYKDFEFEIEKKKRQGKVSEGLQMDETAHFVSYSSVLSTLLIECDAIVAISRSGATARRIARFRPTVPVIVGTYSENVQRLCSLSYGIKAFVIDRKSESKDPFRCLEGEFKEVERIASNKGLLKKGLKVARIAGLTDNKVGDTNLLHIVVV